MAVCGVVPVVLLPGARRDHCRFVSVYYTRYQVLRNVYHCLEILRPFYIINMSRNGIYILGQWWWRSVYRSAKSQILMTPPRVSTGVGRVSTRLERGSHLPMGIHASPIVQPPRYVACPSPHYVMCYFWSYIRVVWLTPNAIPAQLLFEYYRP